MNAKSKKKRIHDNGMPKEISDLNFLSIVLIDSVFKMDKNYYSHVFLEKCKHIVKEKKDKQTY